MDADDDAWPPVDAHARSALWRAEGHLRRHEWAHAARTLDEIEPGTADPGLVAVLRHLAAAGWRKQEGDAERAKRQLRKAEERAEAALEAATDGEVDLEELVEVVAAFVL